MDNLTPFAIESCIAALERTIRRLWILCILLAVFLVASNAAWIYYESQWQVVQETTETTTVDVEGDSAVGIAGDNNEVRYGDSKSD